MPMGNCEARLRCMPYIKPHVSSDSASPARLGSTGDRWYTCLVWDVHPNTVVGSARHVATVALSHLLAFLEPWPTEPIIFFAPCPPSSLKRGYLSERSPRTRISAGSAFGLAFPFCGRVVGSLDRIGSRFRPANRLARSRGSRPLAPPPNTRNECRGGSLG